MDIEKRTAEREAALKQKTENQQKLFKPDEFVYDVQQDGFWCLPNGALLMDRSVDALVPVEYWRVEVEEAGEYSGKGRPPKRKEKLIPPTKDLMRIENGGVVNGSVWWPGMPKIIPDWHISESGFTPMKGARFYNSYKEPPKPKGKSVDASMWINHVKKLWPVESEHEFFFDYCAHMLQHPDQKCNAAIILSGVQGIGKDAALMPVKMAIGEWNTKGIDPDHLFSDYKPWLETVMLVIDEVRPSKDEFHASSMYNILKPMIASPPATLALNQKFQKLRYVINAMRVFITTNDFMAMYIPPEDRRMFVLHSVLEQNWNGKEGHPTYFNQLFAWFENGGFDAVALWLHSRDITAFDCKKPPEKTMGWNAVSAGWDGGGDAVGDALELLGNPDIFFSSELSHLSFDGQDSIDALIKSPRKMAMRMSRSGYVALPPPQGEERWKFFHNGKYFRARTVFVKQRLAMEKSSTLAAINARGAAIAAGQPLLSLVKVEK